MSYQIKGDVEIARDIKINGGLLDDNVVTPIKLGDALNTSVNTTNKTIIGSINEIAASSSNIQVNNVFYVDGKRSDVYTESGSILLPYKTIQAALNAVPVATNSATARNVYLINISPSTYDESLSIDIGRKKVVLYSPGPVSIGTFASSNWAPSGTPRNLTITCSLTNIDSIRTSFSIISSGRSISYGTHQAYSNNFRISGSIVISNSTGGSSGEIVSLEGVNVFGWDGVASGNSDSITAGGWAGNLNMYLETCRFYGALTGGTIRLQIVKNCSFDKLATVATYSQIKDSEIKAGMTWTIAPTEVPPCGIIASSLTGTFTGGTNNNLLLDRVTDYHFTTNAATLAAGVKVILESEAPVSSGPISSVVITENGAGSIDLSSIIVYLYPSVNFTGSIGIYTVPQVLAHQLIANEFIYLCVNYNSGSPIYTYVTDETTINHSTIIPILKLYWEYNAGASIDVIHRISTGVYGLGLANKTAHKFLHTEEFEWESDLQITENGSDFDVEAGVVWYNTERIETLKSQSSLGQIYLYYNVASVWTIAPLATWNSTQYDTGIQLASLSAGRYAVNWIYKSVSSTNNLAYVVLGRGNYTLAQAQASTMLVTLPEVISKTCIFVGRIISDRDTGSVIQIDSPFIPILNNSGIYNHSDLNNVQYAPNPVAGEEYHLSAAQATVVSNTSGSNSGDVTLATDSGLALSGQVLNMGTPSSVTGVSTNSVTTNTHTHALSGTLLLDQTTPQSVINGIPNIKDVYISDLNRNFTTLGTDLKNQTGIPWDDRGKLKISVSYSAPNVVVSLQFVGANTYFTYYLNGKKYTITDLTPFTNKTAAAAEGSWFVYISSSNVFTLTQISWTIYNPDILLFVFLFNATNNTIINIGMEKHAAGRDIFNHARNHQQGAIYKNGFGFSQYNGLTNLSGNTDNNFGRAMVQIAGGSFFDEDMLLNIVHSDDSIASTTAVPYTDWNLTTEQFLGFNALATSQTAIDNVAWSRTGAIATITKINHNLQTGNVITVTNSTNTACIINTTHIITYLSADTFTIVCNEIGTTGTISYAVVVTTTQIVFPTAHTLVTGQGLSAMQDNTTTIRGTSTITTGGTGIAFQITAIAGLVSTDTIVFSGRFPIYYITSSSPYLWRNLTSTDFLGVSGNVGITPATIATAVAQYNLTSGGFTNVTSTRYYPVYLCATNFVCEPIIAIMGQGQSSNSTLSTALTEAPFQFQNLLGLSSLNIQEVVPFMRVTFQYSAAGGFNTSRIRVVDSTFLNLRVATVSGTVISPPITSLAASQVIAETTGFTKVLSTADTNVQLALDTIDENAVSNKGISGGQTIIGSTLTNEDLNLRSNIIDVTTGSVNFLDTLEATNITTASVTMAGGLGVSKNIHAVNGYLTTPTNTTTSIVTIDGIQTLSNKTITTPTITTSAVCPLIIGGSSTTQSLTYKTTTGVGTTGSDHIFQSGNNGATELLRLTHDGRMYGKALHNNAGAVTGPTNQYICSGTYTPTATNGANVSASTPRKCSWLRVGNTVFVSGGLSITTTAANTATTIQLSLPIASSMSNWWDISGRGISDISGNYFAMYQSSQLASILQTSGWPTIGNVNFLIDFSYEIL